MRQQIPATAFVGYDPAYGRNVRVAEFDRPMQSDDVETAQTIAYMEELSSFDAGEQSVIDATHRALEESGLDMSAAAADKAKAIFWWLKRTIRYVPTPATSFRVDQTLIAPSAMLAMKDPVGDCPQFSMLADAMFRNCCMRCLYKTIAAEPELPTIFSHVYNVVEIAPGTWMPFDSSNGPAPGAEFAAPTKKRVWPRTVPDGCRAKKGNLLMMRTGAAAPGWRNGKLRGALAGNGDYGGETNNPASPYDIGGSTQSSSGPSFWTTLANDITAIAVPIVRSATAPKPYYVTTPQGQQILYNPATGAPAVSGSVSISPTLIIGGIILAALLLGKK